MSLVAFLDNAGRADAADGPPREPDAHAARFHRTIPGYAPSALAKAPAAAERLGLSRLLVKRETERFGPPSFKVLGTSWVCRALSLRAGVPPAASFDALRAMIPRLDGITLVAATDGNHGRAVAHMARLLGLGARILVPEHTARDRRLNLPMCPRAARWHPAHRPGPCDRARTRARTWPCPRLRREAP
jgi:diaminopropionate ammonia-lyase